MKRTKIAIVTREGKHEIDGYTSPDFPGLAVHKRPFYSRASWTVTHMASGYRVCTHGWPKRRQAQAYATTLAAGFDWTFTEDVLPKIPGGLYALATRANAAAEHAA